MKKKINYNTSFIVITFLFLVTGSLNAQDCKILKNNKFTYKLRGKDVHVEFKDTKHIEIHQKGKYYIKSNVEWISNCEYYLIIQEYNLPNYPFRVGNKLHVKIMKVRGDRVYYRTTMSKRVWEGKMTKSKNK